MTTQLLTFFITKTKKDIQPVQKELKKVSVKIKFKLISTKNDYLEGLNKLKPDLIISDIDNLSFNGFSALQIGREKYPFVPFIAISASNDINSAVDYMKAGADDYVIISQSGYLGNAAHEAILKKKREQEDHNKLQELLRSEELYRSLVNTTPDGVAVTDLEGNFSLVNQKTVEMMGFNSQKELIGSSSIERVAPEDHVSLQEYVKKNLKNGGIEAFEYNLMRKDGSKFPAEANATTLLNKQGQPSGFLTINRDISRRIEAEKALRKSEQSYRALYENANDAIFLMSKDRIIDCNCKTLEMFGSKKDQIIGTTPFQLSPVNQPDGASSKIKGRKKIESVLTDKPQCFEWQHKRKDGTVFDTEISLNLLKLTTGTYVQAICRDITQRKKAAEALSVSEEQFRTLFQGIFYPTYIWQKQQEDFILINYNTAAEKIEKREIASLKGSTLQQIYGKDEQGIIKDITSCFEQGKSKQRELSYQYKTTNKTRDLVVNYVYTPPDLVMVHTEDVTERNQTEKALLENAERYQNFISNSHEGLWHFELQPPMPVDLAVEKQIEYILNKTTLVETNTVFAKMYGHVTSQEMIGMSLKDFWGEGQATGFKVAADFIQLGYRFPLYETFKETEQGKYKWFLSSAFAVIKNGLLQHIWGTQIEITERKQTENDLKKYANRLQVLHELDKAILAAKKSNTIADEALKKLAKIITLKKACVVEFDFDQKTAMQMAIIPKAKYQHEIGKIYEQKDFQCFISKSVLQGRVHFEKNLKRKRILLDCQKKMLDEGINAFLNIPLLSEKKLIGSLILAAESEDVFTTEKIQIAKEIANLIAVSISQSRLREELKKYTEKLEQRVAERTVQLQNSNNELREFAQIVSHDLKAPLRGINQLSHWLALDYADKIDAEGQEQLSLLVKRVKHMDKLINGILQYSRAGKQSENEFDVDLHVLVQETIDILDPPSDIKITIENQLPIYKGDPIRFQQLFQNLIGNAIKFIDKPRGLIKIGCLQKAEFLQFYISDNGPGVEKKYFDHIFQIFQRLQTTNNEEGTGVGLSLVKRIVKLYGGDVWLKSILKKGTTFYFTMPLKMG